MTKHLLIAALVAFALSACGQQSDTKTGGKAPTPPAADKKPEPPKK